MDDIIKAVVALWNMEVRLLYLIPLPIGWMILEYVVSQRTWSWRRILGWVQVWEASCYLDDGWMHDGRYRTCFESKEGKRTNYIYFGARGRYGAVWKMAVAEGMSVESIESLTWIRTPQATGERWELRLRRWIEMVARIRGK